MSLTPARRRRILTLALPIVAALVSQNLMNLVDTAMVGHLGNHALAAVGMGGLVNFLTAALVLGMSAGVQALVARRVGEGRLDEAAVPLNGGLLLVVVLSIPLTAALILAAPAVMDALLDDPEARGLAVEYVRLRVLGTAALGMNFSFRAFWSATDRPGFYMRTLLGMHVINIVLDWLLIFGELGFPALGTLGAAVAALVAAYCGAARYVWLGLRHARSQGFLRAMPDRALLSSVLRLSAPGGVQQLSFAAGVTAYLWIAGQVGVDALAATHVLLSLLFMGILPGLGFGVAALSLVGQALGRRDLGEARAWGWDVAKVVAVVVVVVSVPALAAPEWMLSFFLHDPATRAVAALPLRVSGLCLATDAVGLVLMNSLLGAGDNRRVMFVATVVQWAVGVPLAYLLGPVLGGGLAGVWFAFLAARQLLSASFVTLWIRGRWVTVRL